jgi:hypothetical protein
MNSLSVFPPIDSLLGNLPILFQRSPRDVRWNRHVFPSLNRCASTVRRQPVSACGGRPTGIQGDAARASTRQTLVCATGNIGREPGTCVRASFAISRSEQTRGDDSNFLVPRRRLVISCPHQLIFTHRPFRTCGTYRRGSHWGWRVPARSSPRYSRRIHSRLSPSYPLQARH